MKNKKLNYKQALDYVVDEFCTDMAICLQPKVYKHFQENQNILMSDIELYYIDEVKLAHFTALGMFDAKLNLRDIKNYILRHGECFGDYFFEEFNRYKGHPDEYEALRQAVIYSCPKVEKE